MTDRASRVSSILTGDGVHVAERAVYSTDYGMRMACSCTGMLLFGPGPVEIISSTPQTTGGVSFSVDVRVTAPTNFMLATRTFMRLNEGFLASEWTLFAQPRKTHRLEHFLVFKLLFLILPEQNSQSLCRSASPTCLKSSTYASALRRR